MLFNPVRDQIRPIEILRQHRKYLSHLLKHEENEAIKPYTLPDSEYQRQYLWKVRVTRENVGDLYPEFQKHFFKTGNDRRFFLDHWFDSNLFEIVFPTLDKIIKSNIAPEKIDEAKFAIREKIANLSGQNIRMSIIFSEIIKSVYL